ncbi:CotZ-related putative spore coat protein [Bacillus sp. BPN334]|uniref:CotZ-related putative spore coat protein n=1 Tax=Bacillus sp. BPN334 TaxID=2217815 RepID=UPI0011EE2143|nr:CotZ-related putative spore coat protein [Bacillus sp. BPN334]KAA0794819.1 hypothetical protein DN393_00045 [Bacillus sp. BPN334]
MNKWLSLELERIIKIPFPPHSTNWPTTSPFCLFNYNGNLFTLTGNSKNGPFTTPFFTVKAVDTKKNCALLELLFPFPVIKNKNTQKMPLNTFCCVEKLFHTENQLFVNLADLCGLTFVDIPTFDCLIKSRVIKNSLCLTYCLTQTCPSRIIWKKSKKYRNNTATITSSYNSGTNSELQIFLYTKTKTYNLFIPKGRCKSITVSDLEYIKIPTPQKFAAGTIQIQLNYYYKEKYYF